MYRSVPVMLLAVVCALGQGPQRLRIGAGVLEKKLIHRVEPQYPPVAQQARVQGTVRLDVLIGTDGTVREIQVVSGHPLLVPAALEAVRQWRYAPVLVNNQPAEVLSQVEVPFSLGAPSKTEEPLLGAQTAPLPLEEPGRTPRIRVGPQVQEAKLLYNPPPAYPPRAQAEGIRGSVRLEILIAADGAVKNVRVLSGHPLLVEAAVEAVRQWRYRPTLVDGEPAEVITEVVVTFPPGERLAEFEGTPRVFRIADGVTPPQLLSKVEPEYTPEAKEAKLEGTVVLTCVIGADGQPRDIQVVKWLGLGLDQKAVEALERWRFRPGFKDGRAVPVEATIEMNFRLL